MSPQINRHGLGTKSGQTSPAFFSSEDRQSIGPEGSLTQACEMRAY